LDGKGKEDLERKAENGGGGANGRGLKVYASGKDFGVSDEGKNGLIGAGGGSARRIRRSGGKRSFCAGLG